MDPVEIKQDNAIAKAIEALELFKDGKSKAAELLRMAIKFPGVPLNERWDLFMKYGEDLGEHKNWIWRPQSLHAKFGSRLSDDFFAEKQRHETHETSRWIEYLGGRKGEKIKWETRNYSDRSQDKIEYIELTEEDINGAMEDILNEFIWSFVYDW